MTVFIVFEYNHTDVDGYVGTFSTLEKAKTTSTSEWKTAPPHVHLAAAWCLMAVEGDDALYIKEVQVDA